MSASTMGRRYERLLFFAGPLALACVVVFFVALALDQQEDRREARCLNALAALVDSQAVELTKAHVDQFASIGADSGYSYWLALRTALIHGKEYDCRQYYEEFIPEKPAAKLLNPKMLSSQARKKAAVLAGKPLAMYGVALPEKATISALGTPVQMELLTFLWAMQIALCPTLLLWLGSLYNTRHRESLYIFQMAEVRSLYPHIVNVYPVLALPHGARFEPRRRGVGGWLFYGANKFVLPAITALVRMGLMSIFLGPPVVFYVGSIYLATTGFSWLSLTLGAVVAVFALANLLAELSPWHVNKRFRVVSPST